MNSILILGGNGRTGRHVVDLAISRGVRVTALVRNPSTLERSSDLLNVVAGSPTNADDVAAAMADADAVVSTLNNGRTSDNPWAKPTSPVDLMEVSIKHAIAAMHDRGIRRISVLSAAGVGDSLEQTPRVFRWLIEHSNMEQAYADHNAVEAVLRASDVDWTLARAMSLNGKNPTAEIIHTYDGAPKPKMKIAREAVARFLLDSLTDDALIGRAPVLSQR